MRWADFRASLWHATPLPFIGLSILASPPPADGVTRKLAPSQTRIFRGKNGSVPTLLLALINAAAQQQRPLSLSLSLSLSSLPWAVTVRRLQIWPKANNIGTNDIVAELSQNGEKDDEDDDDVGDEMGDDDTTGWLALDSIIDAQTSIRSSPKIAK